MVILGGLIFLFGMVDLIGGYAQVDVWSQWMGVERDEFFHRYSPWIAILLGLWLVMKGRSRARRKSSHYGR